MWASIPSGVEKAKDFNPQRDIFGAHVIFVPAVRVDASHRRVNKLLDGLRVQEAEQYDSPIAAAKPKKGSKKGGKDKTSTPSAGPVLVSLPRRASLMRSR